MTPGGCAQGRQGRRDVSAWLLNSDHIFDLFSFFIFIDEEIFTPMALLEAHLLLLCVRFVSHLFSFFLGASVILPLDYFEMCCSVRQGIFLD